MFHLEDDFIPPKEFQMSGVALSIDPENPKKVIIKLGQALKPNHNYVVVLDKSIRSTIGNSLPETMALRFSTEYSPLYAGPLEVHGILRKLYGQFQLSEIYVALRNAGQKAHQLQGLEADPSFSRFSLLTDRDAAYFPTTKYVVYEAARSLLSLLLMRILDDGGLGSTEGTINSDSITLGDLSLSDSSGNGGQGGNSKSSDLVRTVKSALEEVNRELKFWQDAMMGRNRRGYASPISASFRTGAGSPESRVIE